MTSVVSRPSTSTLLARPDRGSQQVASQKSPVYEYSCLFTHDVRRKNTKRWQDGFLRFHVFNKRAMVYDQSRNYIGDTHYQDAGPDGPDDGDEMYLDRNGVLIQVGAKLSMQETDLSELLARRQPKEVPQEPLRRHQTSPNTARPNQPQLQRPPANIAPFTPVNRTSWLGRAQLPHESPFELKRTEAAVAQENDWEQGRPPKRQRRDDEHIPLWQILKTPRPLRAKPNATIPTIMPEEPVALNSGKEKKKGKKAQENSRKADRQSTVKVAEVVDLVSSPVYEVGPRQSTSPNVMRHAQNEHQLEPGQHRPGPLQPESRNKCPVPESSVRKNKIMQASETREKRLESPPVNTTSHAPEAVDRNPAAGLTSSSEPSDNLHTKGQEKASASKRKTKPLRLANAAPRKMLLCQTMGLTSRVRDDAQNLSKDQSGLRTVEEPPRNDLVPEGRPIEVEMGTVEDFDVDWAVASAVDCEEEARRENSHTVHGQRRTCLPEDDDEQSALRNELHEGENSALEMHQLAQMPTGASPSANCAEPEPLRHGVASGAEAPAANEPLAADNASTSRDPTITKPPTKSTAAPRQLEQQRRNPSFRRHCSDTSPTKKAQVHAPLARAETIGARPTSKQMQLPPRRRGLELEAAQKDADAGPWSREAWDLFGWCPDGRREALGWTYGEGDEGIVGAAA